MYRASSASSLGGGSSADGAALSHGSGGGPPSMGLGISPSISEAAAHDAMPFFHTLSVGLSWPAEARCFEFLFGNWPSALPVLPVVPLVRHWPAPTISEARSRHGGGTRAQ